MSSKKTGWNLFFVWLLATRYGPKKVKNIMPEFIFFDAGSNRNGVGIRTKAQKRVFLFPNRLPG